MAFNTYSVDDILELTKDKFSKYDGSFRVVPPIFVSRFFLISIQGSENHECSPKETLLDFDAYTHVEFCITLQDGQPKRHLEAIDGLVRKSLRLVGDWPISDSLVYYSVSKADLRTILNLVDDWIRLQPDLNQFKNIRI